MQYHNNTYSTFLFTSIFILLFNISSVHSITAGQPCKNELIIAKEGQCNTTIVVSPNAKRNNKDLRKDTSPTRFERFAAEDLAKYINLMTGGKPKIADTSQTISTALKEKNKPIIIIGSEALKTEPILMKKLTKVAKPNPILRADAIVLYRQANRLYLAGLTDDGHYHAVAELLHRWGARWYFPTDFGECIPKHKILKIGNIDYSYSSPFEIRSYWISWNGSYKGYIAFKLRNMMTIGVPKVATGHALGPMTVELVPKGKTIFDIPIASEHTAIHVAKKVIETIRKNKENTASLSISDGVYKSDYPCDKKLQAGIFDKYFLMPSMTDVFMTLYNRVCEIISRKYPNLNPRLGFLAYSNMTIPPQRILHAHKFLFCTLAPIDIDPIHDMDNSFSPAKQEFKQMMYRWTDIMKGRIIIYDYDQSMLVWRDIPNPSHQAFRFDIKHYAKAGVLGFRTESRNAIATTFLNLYLRGLLMWNPNTNIDAHLDEFYHLFYGPAAKPMKHYWKTIFDAWKNTIVTEHEFFIIPAIYTPKLIDTLDKDIIQAEILTKKYVKQTQDNKVAKHYIERMQFTRLSYDVLSKYVKMLSAGATNCKFSKANKIGKSALKSLKELAKMNPTFTTRILGKPKLPDYGGSPAWWPGEVKLYEDLQKLTDGSKGKLLAVLPLTWAFHRDPQDTGLVSGWAYQKNIDLSYWNEHKSNINVWNRKDYPTTEWEKLRTDLYIQAQGILHPDCQSFTGFVWYRTNVKIEQSDINKKIHIMFPGLFGKSWLYINGKLIKFREQNPIWWKNDYSFKWDVNIANVLRPGENLIVLRNQVHTHFGGMFRRPFLYISVK